MRARRPSRVLVMPEFGIDLLPLWDRSPEGGGALGEDDVDISVQPATRLRDWNARWADHPPELPRRWSAEEETQWLDIGHRLARQLEAELTDVEVLILDSKGKEIPVSESR